jgi:hypothetical protein
MTSRCPGSLPGRCRAHPGTILLVLLALLALGQPASADPFTVFSSSPLYQTPETISPAPAGFGGFAGQYFIPDANRGAPNPPVFVVPTAGGAPTNFATDPGILPRGGVFLPATGWGANSGNFAVVGPGFSSGVETGMSSVTIYNAAGSASQFLQTAGSFAQPRIAPAAFGAFGNDLIVANTTPFNNILAITAAGGTMIVANTAIAPFGLAFAPAGFGTFGNQLFASSANSGQIVAIAPDGTVTPFATIPLLAGQTSLFQMEFSPVNFIPGFGSLLFVSVRGSTAGGGTLGDVVALDSNGNIISHLRSDLGISSFDPRGLFFPAGNQLLVSDASGTSGRILLITSSDFINVVPEPTSLTLLGVGTLSLLAYGWRRAVRPKT